MYKSELDLALADINIPNVYSSSVADTSEVSRLIDTYYTDIMSCINVTSRKVIPCKKSKGYLLITLCLDGMTLPVTSMMLQGVLS